MDFLSPSRSKWQMGPSSPRREPFPSPPSRLTTVQSFNIVSPQPAQPQQRLAGKVMSLLFNTLSWFVIVFLPRNKRLSVSWLQSPSEVILKLKKIKSVTVSIVFPSICHEGMGLHAIILFFGILSIFGIFEVSFFTLFHLHQEALQFLFTFCLRVVSSAYLRLLIVLPAVLILVCASSTLACHLMYSACKLIKQGDNIHP